MGFLKVLGRFGNEEKIYFDRVFLKVLDDVLKSILGDMAKETIIHYLERHHSLRWCEIPENIELFSEALKEVLGSSITILESLVIQKLCFRLSIKGGKSFADIRKLKIEFEKRRKNSEFFTSESRDHAKE